MAVEKHTMTDEEYDEYRNLCLSINEVLQGSTIHLVTPVLVKILVSSYLLVKGFTEETPRARELHDNLIAEITYLIAHRTNEEIQKLRERN